MAGGAGGGGGATRKDFLFTTEYFNNKGITNQVVAFKQSKENIEIHFKQKDNSATIRFDFIQNDDAPVKLQVTDGVLTAKLTEPEHIKTAKKLKFFNENALLQFVSDKACNDIRWPIVGRILNL